VQLPASGYNTYTPSDDRSPWLKRTSTQRAGQGHGSLSDATSSKPMANTPTNGTQNTNELKRWLPNSGEFISSVGLGVLGGLLIAPFWVRHKLPHNANAVSQADMVEHLLSNDTEPLASPIKKKATGTSLGATSESGVKEPKRRNEIAAFLANPAALMIMIPTLAPQLTQPAIAVSALLGLGYLGTNLLSGMQEVWVRYQESQIRANLVASLDEAFQTSIERKTGVDEQNKRYATTQIATMLWQAGVKNPQRYLMPVWEDSNSPGTMEENYLNDSREKQVKTQMRQRAVQQQQLVQQRNMRNQRFVLYPQTPASTAAPPREASRFGTPSASTNAPPATPPPTTHSALGIFTDDQQRNAFRPLPQMARQPVAPYRHVSRLTLDGIGAALGLSMTSIALYAVKALHDGLTPMSNKIKAQPDKAVDIIKTTLAPRDAEAVLMHFFSQKENIFMGGLFLAMGIMLKTAQFLAEGLREIEVTNLNAETERQYEDYKLTELEPHFKAVSERAQLKHALENLKRDLPLLKQHPDALHLRVQRIMDSIGMSWSAPNYYPMAPMVQLVPARS
jgi:hypothetical protein